MDFIDSQKIMFDALMDIYDEENYLRELVHKSNQIINVIEQIFDDEAKNFELVYKNSIQNGKYYKIESRIKKAESLREKFYRRNIGLELIRELGLNPENINYKAIRKKIRQAYNMLDDVIGIRIVTELKADSMSALSLIENRMSLFNQGGIFFKTDFKGQPEVMDNGLEIIKLKGVFEEKNAFELQIKSKIDAAWGDIDHKLFYKDYNSSPIKDGLQVSMNNIGELLNHIEKFLFDLRETNNEVEDKDINQILVEHLFEVVSPDIDNKLKIKYDFKRILEPVLFFADELHVGDVIGALNYDYFETVTDFTDFATYESIRKCNFDYVLIETIFVNCLMKVEYTENQSIDFNNELKHYFVVLSKYCEKKIREVEFKLEPSYYKHIYRKMMLLLGHLDNPDILFAYNTYRKIWLIDQIIIDVIVENEMHQEGHHVSDIFTLFTFTEGKLAKEITYNSDVDYIGVLTKVKRQVEAMDNQELLKFFNQVLLKIAKDIESKEDIL